MFGNLQSEKTGADLQQKLDNQSTQYGKTRVHRNESNLNDLDPDMDPSRLWKSSEGRTVCEEHQVDASDVLSDIGDNFHDLADLFSVL
ncbi:hypothetical protein JR053_02135 [Wolbachia endosymbiont of Nasonia vitripennis]|uniref:hypothetical protein n=1 Tax=unclassified Wolbachia TaxID=2640676 RepID=UPI00111973A4|nr:hypothetical protein [Wolbachia endosymbiont of Leptopilina clavipes]TNK93795.1 hypothetical protein OUY_04510 [Wolbachia endosymbiont of Leptopilina clavipes]